jgi:putative ABC transport system substrate-binding protein
MTRRAAFLVAIALGAAGAGAPPIATAQQSAKVFHIGILSPAGSPSTKAFDALREGLRELGYIDGANVVIEEPFRQLCCPGLRSGNRAPLPDPTAAMTSSQIRASESQVRTRLLAGGSRIRTIGPSRTTSTRMA